MIQKQQTMILSPYMDIYNLVVPKDNLLRRINELVDFSFVYNELMDKYCTDNGRNAINPIRMFKYLLLKCIFDLSDAGMYVCKAGHMAYRKIYQNRDKEKKNPRVLYDFDIEKCRICTVREGCYRDGAKRKSYSVTLISNVHSEHVNFQNSAFFKEKTKERYKIEAKNSELKYRHGYDVASSSGLVGMQIQGATSIFAVNMKRIIKLLG